MFWLTRISRTVFIRHINVLALLVALPFWPGCQADRDRAGSEQVEVIFTASGITIPGTFSADIPHAVTIDDGDRSIDVAADVVAGSLCLDFSWEPGKEYLIQLGEAPKRELKAVAPQQASLAILKILPIGDDLLSLKINRTESKPSAVAISQDGAWLAVGSSVGDVSLISIASGEIRSKLSGFKSYIRSLAIARLGKEIFLFVGEQSPNGTLTAFRSGPGGEMKKEWSYECHRDIGMGTLAADDPYSWAHQPGIYRILPTRDGALLALATHSDYRDGKRLTSSCLYKFEAAGGKLLWKWPKIKAYDAVATWFSIDKEGQFAALCAYSQSGEGEVVLIDCINGGTLKRTTFDPLQPHLQQVNFWKSVALTPDGKTVAVLSDDGRAWLWDWAEEKLADIVLGKPILMGSIPLLVSGAGVAVRNSDIIFITGVTYLPWDLAEGRKPHQPHPAAQRLFGFDRDGKREWEVPLPNLVQGFAIDSGGKWLLASYSSDPDFAPGGGSGMMVFDMQHSRPILVASYSVEGGVLHGTPVISTDGRTVVIVEERQRDDTGEKVRGHNALHILHW